MSQTSLSIQGAGDACCGGGASRLEVMLEVMLIRRDARHESRLKSRVSDCEEEMATGRCW
jgi:hypothetical protein